MTGKNPLPVLPSHITIVDTHCHLDMADYNHDREDVISHAESSNVTKVITIGIDLKSSQKSVELADSHPALYASVGIHPHNVTKLNDSCYEKLISLASCPKVVAYGEIGLDFIKLYAPAELQKNHFRQQIQIAKELNLPIIIHDRGAHKEILTILQEQAPYPAGGVMHCFSGDMNLAKTVLDFGFYISIPGIVTFSKATELQEVARHTPLSSLLLETDGPFLAPIPKRGRRNKPEYILYTAQKVAELRGISLEEVAQKTTENAESLFLFDD